MTVSCFILYFGTFKRSHGLPFQEKSELSFFLSHYAMVYTCTLIQLSTFWRFFQTHVHQHLLCMQVQIQLRLIKGPKKPQWYLSALPARSDTKSSPSSSLNEPLRTLRRRSSQLEATHNHRISYEERSWDAENRVLQFPASPATYRSRFQWGYVQQHDQFQNREGRWNTQSPTTSWSRRCGRWRSLQEVMSVELPFIQFGDQVKSDVY